VEGLSSIDLENLDALSLLDLVTKSKFHSAAFQVYLQSSSPSKKLTNMIISNINRLVQEKYGCHLLRRLAVTSDRLMLILCRMSLEHFFLWSTNEYSSRVMQTLAAVQPFFRNQYLDMICDNWSELYQQVPIYYLLEICLKNSNNSELAFQRVGKMLLESADSLKENKAYKKLLGLYLEHCSTEELTVFYTHLKFELELANRIEDKYYFCMLRTLFKRNFLPAISLISIARCLGSAPRDMPSSKALEQLDDVRFKFNAKNFRSRPQFDGLVHSTMSARHRAQKAIEKKLASVPQSINCCAAPPTLASLQPRLIRMNNLAKSPIA
jgi:hypothetical protein